MNILSHLKPIVSKSAKRRGRGIGSGVGGHTTGRGAKGDKVRGSTKLTFDGTKIKKSWIKRLPFLRGKHRTNALNKFQTITLSQIEKVYKSGDTVTLKNIFEKFPRLDARMYKLGVKILSTGTLQKKLTFQNIKMTESATKKVNAAGGKIEG
ncbi:50S ribosomal protein L15 [Candidatus Shapirobacteria bacterium CG06_land_8_20_14_3_00_40_12]|uniref:Large ribosomal subunit protein uL15 n=2 Tax=Candidatus Shapironibacteriota TaxID=1752721 RepID=A0A2M7TSY0_9BACT|nr:MAG: 50S ribosomal protein L15 [Candidatus Shapirobacteria bacterium CG06_land_8_20_14_3_00_40_12]PIZ58925.1 MAG: 50S ribosomal protein L15 [Candidatus Shapirobacteria bacterium CG_4_10_14_0_2_um_filter_40_12]